MFKLISVVFIVTLVRTRTQEVNLKFPKGFLLGAASSAYQVEGAWNVGDKSPSNWDDFVHNHPEKIDDRSTGDVSCDSYNRYEEDLDILKNLNVDHYRFSLSWSRILPKGHAGYISQDGIDHYTKIFDALDERGIVPFVTIYHWDHPRIIEEYGGWLNNSMPFWYADYARVVFNAFANRVKFFATLNEPSIFCTTAYKGGNYPPSIDLTGMGEYRCVHNMLKANALAYHIYKNEFSQKYNGTIGIVLQCKNPYSSNPNDTRSGDIAFEFECGWQAHPIFSSTGDYPKIMKDMVASRSRAQGYRVSRLPKFSKKWIKFIKGSADFFGLNHYTSTLAASVDAPILDWPNDEGLDYFDDPNWPTAQSSWLKIVPEGLGDLLRTIKNKYNNPVVYITENGVSDGNGIEDDLRINYLYSYMKEMLIAIERDNCNVKAHTIWSLLDSFEWSFGYHDKFGLISVDFTNENRTRTYKKSAMWWRNVIRTRELLNP